MRLPSLVFVLVCVAAFQKFVRSNETFRRREPRDISFIFEADDFYHDREQNIPDPLAPDFHEADYNEHHTNPISDEYSTSLGFEGVIVVPAEAATSFEREDNENHNIANQQGFDMNEIQIITENYRGFHKEATEEQEFENDQQVFRVFWNVPSKECFNFNITLRPEQYGFTVNEDQDFNGDQIVLMYGPGETS